MSTEEEDITTHDLKMFNTPKEYADCLLSRLRPGEVALWDGTFETFEGRKLDKEGNWTGEVKWGQIPVTGNINEAVLHEYGQHILSVANMIDMKDCDIACYSAQLAFLSRSRTTRLSRERVKGAKVEREEESN